MSPEDFQAKLYEGAEQALTTLLRLTQTANDERVRLEAAKAILEFAAFEHDTEEPTE